MGKNYKSAYSSSNDSMAISQRFYAKVETTRGTLAAPTDTDFFFTQQGGTITYAQNITSSMHRSDRHHTSTIVEKKTCEWSIPTYVNIDTAVAAGSTEVDAAIQLLWESMLGRKTISSGVIFDAVTAPNITFSLFNCGDVWAEQTRGCFVEQAEVTLPGDGQAGTVFSGNAKDRLLVGIGKSVTANAGNTVTVATGEGSRFPVGALVMIIKSDGTTRSTDTPNGSPRTVTNVTGDVVTLSGAVLTDADGSVALTPVYLAYYEPTTPTAINNPITGLVGSFGLDLLPSLSCVRTAKITMKNNHELQNFCYGTDSLSGAIFVPGSRLDVNISMDLNLNSNLVEYLNKLNSFTANDMYFILGSASGRRLRIDLPKVIFPIPAINVPESGSIPVTFDNGLAYQTAIDQADEVTVSYL